jgi:hypothetical protein
MRTFLGIVLFLVAGAIALVIIGILVKGVFYLIIIGAVVLAIMLIIGGLRSVRGPRRRTHR